MCAASGTPPHTNNAFRAEELPDLFEQLAVQLQDFPAPPLRYCSQAEEPDLTSDANVRVITGFSGAGKTMWFAQAAQHSTAALAYFDVGDTPGPAVALPLARELAGRFFGTGGGLGQLLLPGATGTEMLRAIGLRLQAEKIDATIVIDNAHRVPAENLRALVQQTPHAHFIFLAQPGGAVQELQATLGLTPAASRLTDFDLIASEHAFSAGATRPISQRRRRCSAVNSRFLSPVVWAGRDFSLLKTGKWAILATQLPGIREMPAKLAARFDNKPPNRTYA